MDKIINNCCSNCNHEKTCGYSPLAMIGCRTEYSFKKCCLGEKSWNMGTFFEAKDNIEKTEN